MSEIHGYGSLPRGRHDAGSPLSISKVESPEAIIPEEMDIDNSGPIIDSLFTTKNPLAHNKMYDDLSWKYIYQQRMRLEQNWTEGKYSTSTITGHTDAVYCLQFDSKKVLSGSRDNTIKMWDIDTGKCWGKCL